MPVVACVSVAAVTSFVCRGNVHGNIEPLIINGRLFWLVYHRIYSFSQGKVFDPEVKSEIRLTLLMQNSRKNFQEL
jgi:hypothetical protein